jgi:hypothetical protein
MNDGPEHVRDPGMRRPVVAFVAIMVFGVAGAFAWRVFEPVREAASGSTSSPSAPGDPWAGYAEGWSELPPPPELRDGADLVWMDDRLLAWGGSPRGVDAAQPAADGFVFDPLRGTWAGIAPAPAAGSGGDAVWTGSEVVLWGVRAADADVSLAFDPGTETWRRIADPPHDPRWGGAHVWTGREIVLFGGGLQGSSTTREGAAYDPSTDTWRTIADAPVGVNLADATWTGREMIVIGSEIDNRNVATTATAVAEAYDPSSDSWRRLPDPPISPQTSAIAFVGGRVVGWEAYSPSSAEYLADEDRWRSLDTGDLEGGECYAEGVVTGDTLFTWDCGDPAAWFGQPSSWVRLPPVPLTVSDPSLAYGWASVTAAGSAVVVDQVETVVGEGGDPYLGSPDAPVHMWVWRPPSTPGFPTSAPTADDATYLLSVFLDSWSREIWPYIPVYATTEVLAKIDADGGGLDVFRARPFRNWRFPSSSDLDGGRFEARVALTSQDGREDAGL